MFPPVLPPIPPPTIPDAAPGAFGQAFKSLAAQVPKNPGKIEGGARAIWPAVGARGIDPATMACDADLITLGLAKDDGGIVYMKFDLSGWDE
jgi:hypothetical protein